MSRITKTYSRTNTRKSGREVRHSDEFSYLNFEHNPNVVLRKDQSNLRVMTYNLHGFIDTNHRNHYDEILSVVQTIDPDVVAFEEVYLFKRGEIDEQKFAVDLKRIGLKFGSFSKTGINAVFSRYPFVTREIDLGRDPVMKIHRNALICNFLDVAVTNPSTKIKDSLKNIVVVGTHLDVFDESGETRSLQMKKILKSIETELDSDLRIIVTGDFNTLRKDDYTAKEWEYITQVDSRRRVKTVLDAVPIIEEAGFVDSFVSCNTPIKSSVWSGRRIDFIFGMNVEFIQSADYKVTYSDHYPIYADVVK